MNDFNGNDMDAIYVHPSAIIDEGVKIGCGTKIWHFCHVMQSARIGEKCNIGQNVFIDSGVIIGNACKIQNNVSVYKYVTLEDNVFCGPSMVFTNVYNPRAAIPRMSEALPTLVKIGATLGANCTIICGITIGKYAFVGAGAVVTKNIPNYALVYGTPAAFHGWICECGEKLSPALECAACGKRYKKSDDGLEPVA